MPDPWYTRRSAPMRFLPCPRCCKRFEERTCQYCQDGNVPDAMQVVIEGIVGKDELNTTYILDDYWVILGGPTGWNGYNICNYSYRPEGSLGPAYLSDVMVRIGSEYGPPIGGNLNVMMWFRDRPYYTMVGFSKTMSQPQDCTAFSDLELPYCTETREHLEEIDFTNATATITAL